MNNPTYIDYNYLLSTQRYTSVSGAKTAMWRCRKVLGVKPYSKIRLEEWLEYERKCRIKT